MRKIVRAGALVMSSWGSIVAAAPAQHPLYAVVRVGAALADEDKVGVKRAGLACLPNGVLRWKDVATGGTMDQREIVQDALEDTGLPLTPLGMLDEPMRRPALRLRATIKAAAFRLCARQYLGDAKAYSGDAALDVEWRVESAEGGEAPHASHVSRHVESDHAASLGSLYRQLLGDAARDAAHWLLAPQTESPR